MFVFEYTTDILPPHMRSPVLVGWSSTSLIDKSVPCVPVGPACFCTREAAYIYFQPKRARTKAVILEALGSISVLNWEK